MTEHCSHCGSVLDDYGTKDFMFHYPNGSCAWGKLRGRHCNNCGDGVVLAHEFEEDAKRALNNKNTNQPRYEDTLVERRKSK